MPRVTEEERARFHRYLDEVIDKLNNTKNSSKNHWSCSTDLILSKMNLIEAHELELAIYEGNNEGIISECKDGIAFPLFIIDNLRGNK